mgnify:CR=1 FL=1|tara:strand:- start:231 stop:473 length:243 start_codon:yes stop_codon:yes gene_type:complete
MKEEILFFSAPWCGPCKQMKTMLSENVRDELNIKIIDISEDMEIAAKYEVMNVPSFVKVKDDKVISRKVGSTTIEGLKVL